ncbi:helix-turn-helix domain-containing protein [Streptacidiphilus anmyonensis]|uniref:helix-turn-helix domain-containing protein n=1 Tax=Streptacidiphilus anmyonensis TaxID=405782 RepID=UPI0005AAE11C|nr:helix-turn-helix transcriptional regulator [Streptacidiphilus anmyonensis]
MATRIEDFAALLRELKERSGRSYGQLATRLHVSTSTLHRYCNGAAVPTDYAPVERLARLCGATPDELVILHRRWLLADAARREPERAAEEPEPLSTVAPEVVESAPGTAEPVDAHVLQRLPRLRRPRRSVLVLSTVAAVAGLATVAALPVALHGGGAGGGAQNTGATTPLALRASTGAAGATGATGPSGPPPDASATASASSSGSPSSANGTPSTSASAGGGQSGAGNGQPLISVNVLADNWDMQCGQWFLMQQQPGKVPPPPSLEQTGAWASALGGVPGGHLRLQLTVQSTNGQPVVLHALFVHVISSKPAPKGNAFTPGSGCGGGLDPASFAVNLDQPVPRTTPVAGYVGNGVTATVTNFPYQVSAGDPQVLDVDASTVGRDVSWYLELSWSSGDRQGQLPITSQGRPFRTVGLQGDPAYFYDGTAWSHTSVDE